MLLLIIMITMIACSHEQKPKIIKDLKPTVILISIDGFRNDYLEKLPVPNLSRLAKKGVHTALMSVFPSVTFPNHYSIATGLYPEHHGIMLNEFTISGIDEPFTHHGHAPAVTNPRWWQGEPIWVTAEKQGQLTASAFWPSSGSTIGGVKPTYYQDFTEDGDPQQRIQQILHWLDLPVEKRPTFLALYFENVDNAGHHSGPDSKEVRDAGINVDKALGTLVFGLKQRGIESSINLVIVSDHGMSKVDPKKIIDLEKFVKKNSITIMGEGAIVGVYPKPGQLNAVYQSLRKSNAPMFVYRESDIPTKLHYKYPHRTPPILCVANEQAFILGEDKKLQSGTHGYNPELKSMRGIFIAYGPAFKIGYTRSPFRNINIYSLLTYILDLKPAHNDGSLKEIKDVLIVSPTS
jgi:predicted AlkP superfamily pyrophosphatase or phosphodiesterase